MEPVKRRRVVLGGRSYSNLLLDELAASGTTLKGVWIPNKALDTYSGFVNKVRRSNDNVTQQIGFDGSDYDNSGFSSFIGTGSSYLDTFYDQAGSSNLIQVLTSNQPSITLNELSKAPAMVYSANQWLQDATLTPSTQSTAFIIFKLTNLLQNQAIFGFPGASNTYYGLYYRGTDVSKGFGFNTWNSDIYGITNADVVLNTYKLVTACFDSISPKGSNIRLRINGVDQALSQITGSTVPRALNSGVYLSRGGVTGTQHVQGNIAGVILCNGILSTQAIGDTENKLNLYYSIY